MGLVGLIAAVSRSFFISFSVVGASGGAWLWDAPEPPRFPVANFVIPSVISLGGRILPSLGGFLERLGAGQRQARYRDGQGRHADTLSDAIDKRWPLDSYWG